MKIDQMSKFKQVMFFLSIALTVLISDAAMIYTPLLNDMYAAFPEEAAAMNLFVSLPAFILIVSSLVVPTVLKVLGRRNTLLIALAVAAVSGIAMAFVDNAWLLVALNGINAVAQGFVSVGGVIIITDYIAGEAYRTRITGWYCVGVSLGATVLPIVSGSLGIHGWQTGFSAYWLFLIPLVLCAFFVPTDKQVGCDVVAQEDKGVKSKAPFGKRFIVFALVLIVYYSLNNCYTWYYSVYVAEMNLGDTAFSGLVGSACNFAGMLTGLVFGWLMSRTKKNMAWLCYACVALGLALLYFFPNRIVAVACSALLGSTIGLIYPFGFALCAAVCPQEKQSQAIAIVTAISGVGGLLAPYFVDYGTTLCGSYRGFLIVIAVVMVGMTVIEAVSCRNDKIGEA